MITGKQARKQSQTDSPDPVVREILLGFWKVHILHHAAEGPVYGQWIASELRRHGYHISPGTLYPMLKRMETNGWLKSPSRTAGRYPRKEYKLTREGAKVLRGIRAQVQELYQEVVAEKTISKTRL